jgi:23S rRNA pseudouridine2605 synthase
MRLQVFLSHAGVASRRKALDLIKSGHVIVNHKKVCEPSYPVQKSDVIAFDNKRLVLLEEVYLLLNKPKGVVTTASDPFAEKTIMDLLPKNFAHLHPVGRLDKDTTGLLLLTNDGALAHCLSHPSFEVEKTYLVCLDKSLTQDDWRKLEKGILIHSATFKLHPLGWSKNTRSRVSPSSKPRPFRPGVEGLIDEERTSRCRIKNAGPYLYEVVIHEGRKRQIRRMFAALRYRVKELSRIKHGSLVLGDLKPGAWRLLAKDEIARLKKEIKIS